MRTWGHFIDNSFCVDTNF